MSELAFIHQNDIMALVNDLESKLLSTADQLRDQQLAWTRALIAIPTVNPYSGDSSAGIETAGQQWFAEQCHALGGCVNTIPVPDDIYRRIGLIGTAGRSWKARENVVSTWEFGCGGPTVILNTHMDTVGTEGMVFDPFDPRIHGGRLYGRGTSDSKGNLIVGLTALAALRRHAGKLNGRVILESVVDEECNGAGAGTLACCLAGIDGDFSICLDGSYDAIHNGCNGIATPRLTIEGRAGHAATGGAINAIDKAFMVKQAIDVFADQHMQTFPGCRINLGVFRSGTLPAIVPASAEMQLNISYATDDARSAEETNGCWNGALLRQRFEQMLDQLAATDAWFKNHPVRVEWLKDVYPFYCAADDAHSQTVIRAVQELASDPIPVHPMPAWFDAAHLSRVLGKPVLGIGSGTPGCSHGADEYADIDCLYQGTRKVALSLHRLLSAV